MIDPVSITGNGALNLQGNAASASLANNFDQFLTLLTTQLRHQDPLQPMDANDFTQQLVQFSGVEQAIRTNQNLEILMGLVQSNQGAGLVAYLGKSVDFEDDRSMLRNGQATWSYDLPRDAARTQLHIFNEQGALVWSGEGTRTAGTHALNWDGLSQAGATLPDGLYRLVVAAADADDQAIAATITARGTVSAVETAHGATVLKVDGRDVTLDRITAVRLPAVP